jgi:hypothetical protein
MFQTVEEALRVGYGAPLPGTAAAEAPEGSAHECCVGVRVCVGGLADGQVGGLVCGRERESVCVCVK